MVEDIVAVLMSCCIARAGGISPEEDVIVCERPDGGAPKMLEKAASRWLLGA